MEEESLDRLSDVQFRRLTGLKRPMFRKMIQTLHGAQRFRKGGMHADTLLPIKESKHSPLTEAQKRYNKMHASERVIAEHVIRVLKRFHILADRYRNRRKRFGLRFNLIAAIYNQGLKL